MTHDYLGSLVTNVQIPTEYNIGVQRKVPIFGRPNRNIAIDCLLFFSSTHSNLRRENIKSAHIFTFTICCCVLTIKIGTVSLRKNFY